MAALIWNNDDIAWDNDLGLTWADEVYGSIDPELNTWPDPSKVLATETWYENGVLKTGTMTSGGASLLYVIATQ